LREAINRINVVIKNMQTEVARSILRRMVNQLTTPPSDVETAPFSWSSCVTWLDTSMVIPMVERD